MLLKNIYQRNHRFIENVFTGIRNLTSHTMNIQNFVFFDIETTGLPYEEYNKTRITEMCLVAVEKDHISLGVYPRVQNKLSFCFNPRKIISPTSSKITGLTNDLLESQPDFGKQTCEIVNNFLELQRKPICFVAHNGNNFDYPILKAELHKVGCELIDNILCIDSLEMFRDLEIRKIIASKHEEEYLHTKSDTFDQRNNEVNVHNLPTQKNIPVELCDGYDELLLSVVDGVEMTTTNNIREAQHLNENTPKKLNKAVNHNNDRYTMNALQDHLYYTPNVNDRDNASTGANFSHGNTTKISPSRKKINFGKESYKLTDIFKRLTKKENSKAHLADEDVNMLIECAAILGQDFVNWANINAKQFSEIPMMKPGVKIGS